MEGRTERWFGSTGLQAVPGGECANVSGVSAILPPPPSSRSTRRLRTCNSGGLFPGAQGTPPSPQPGGQRAAPGWAPPPSCSSPALDAFGIKTSTWRFPARGVFSVRTPEEAHDLNCGVHGELPGLGTALPRPRQKWGVRGGLSCSTQPVWLSWTHVTFLGQNFYFIIFFRFYF